MAETRYTVELAAHFLAGLDSINRFLQEADAGFAYDDLLAQLRAELIPNLSRFPGMGRRYLDNPPRSVEGLGVLATLPPGAADRLRLILLGDYLVLYVEDERKRTVTLLSIRHHRQLSFDFVRMWSDE
ncbi:MAG: plasmid stabilization protein [Hydrogenophilales bacterium 17-64-11]|nr:MAG: plasmid stabilization protein [Hydrogenophilales bacterium 17-64-11]